MTRILIGAALALAFAATHAEAAARAHKAAHPRPAPVGLSIGKTALPGHATASSGHRFGAVLPTAGCDPGFVPGQVPPAATWNLKIGCAFPKAGGLLQGPLGLPASTMTTAPFNIAQGTAPSSPSDGDIWTSTSGLFAHVGGSTIGPLGAGGGGSSNTSFLASGVYVNVPAVTTSASQSLSSFLGPNVLLKNYGSTQIAFHAAVGSATVTVGTSDGIIEPGGTQEIALGTNTAIAVASVVNGAVSGTGSVQIIDGSGLWTGSGGGGTSGSGGAVTISGPLGTQSIAAAVAITPATSSTFTVVQPTAANLNATVVGPSGAALATAANQNVTAAGTSASNAQAVQGLNGAVPIRVRCPDDTTSCFGGSVGANVTVVAVPADASVSGSSPLTAADSGGSSTSTAGAGGLIWSGSPLAASVETFSLNTYQGALISARGTFTNTTTLVIQGTLDSAAAQASGAAKWVDEPVVLPGQSGSASSFNAPFEQAALTAAGLQGVRCRIPSGQYTTGDSIACTVRTTLSQPANIWQGVNASHPIYAQGNIVQANASIPINISSSGTTQLINAVSGKVIYVTHWDVTTGNTSNLTLEYGTGTNCTGSPQALTGPYGLNPTSLPGLSPGVGLGPILSVPAGNGLCAVISAAGQFSGSMAYTQF